jgi:hypothetical protein
MLRRRADRCQVPQLRRPAHHQRLKCGSSKAAGTRAHDPASGLTQHLRPLSPRGRRAGWGGCPARSAAAHCATAPIGLWGPPGPPAHQQAHSAPAASRPISVDGLLCTAVAIALPFASTRGRECAGRNFRPESYGDLSQQLPNSCFADFGNFANYFHL